MWVVFSAGEDGSHVGDDDESRMNGSLNGESYSDVVNNYSIGGGGDQYDFVLLPFCSGSYTGCGYEGLIIITMSVW